MTRAEIAMYEADCRLQGGTDVCEKCNSNGSYEDRATCDRILSLKLSELEEEGYSEVQGDIVEVE